MVRSSGMGGAQVGHDEHGLPIGLQLMGRPWAEATLLRVAAAVEVCARVSLRLGRVADHFLLVKQELCRGRRRRPSSFYDVLGGRREDNPKMNAF